MYLCWWQSYFVHRLSTGRGTAGVHLTQGSTVNREPEQTKKSAADYFSSKSKSIHPSIHLLPLIRGRVAGAAA